MDILVTFEDGSTALLSETDTLWRTWREERGSSTVTLPLRDALGLGGDVQVVGGFRQCRVETLKEQATRLRLERDVAIARAGGAERCLSELRRWAEDDVPGLCQGVAQEVAGRIERAFGRHGPFSVEVAIASFLRTGPKTEAVIVRHVEALARRQFGDDAASQKPGTVNILFAMTRTRTLDCYRATTKDADGSTPVVFSLRDT